MADKTSEPEPVSAQPLTADDGSPTEWAYARGRLEGAMFYWLATVRPDGRPHVMPLLGVWVDGTLHFVAGATTRKARNLRRDSHCVITADSQGLHLVLEGEAATVRDE
jgi:general stress protein 26